MNELEILGLIILVYADNCKYEKMAWEVNGKNQPLWHLTHHTHNYLTRKGYFDKRSQRPTLKLYELLHKHNVRIEQFKEWQDEFAKTGHVTQYDKLGNKKVL